MQVRINPELVPADWTPSLRVLSLDIETDPAARRLLAVGLHGCGASEVLLLTPEGRACPQQARPFQTQKELLAGFCVRVRELDPDVLTGWNVVDFDLAVLDRLAATERVPLELGRGPGTLRLRAQGGSRGARQASVPGRVVLDGIHLLRGAFVRMDDYGLDAVARTVLGEGKTLAGRGRAEEILRLFDTQQTQAASVQVLVLFLGLVLWGFWRWLKIRQSWRWKVSMAPMPPFCAAGGSASRARW